MAGGKNQSQVAIAGLRSGRWRRCGLPLSLLQSSKGREGDELPKRIHVRMMPEDTCVLVSMHVCVHTWAVVAAAEDGLVSLDHNEASSRLAFTHKARFPDSQNATKV